MSVLVTRPEPQATELVELLAKENITAYAVPVVEFGEPEDLTQTKMQLSDIKPDDTCIFISRQAVHGAVKHFDGLPQCQLVAIGQGTADALNSHGASDVIFPDQASTEGLLTEIDIEKFIANPVHIIRGGDGKESLFNALKKQNIDVQYIDTYGRRCKTENAELLLDHLVRDKIDLVVLTSCQLADMFLELLGEQHQRLSALMLTSMSKEMLAWMAMREVGGVLPLASGKNERIVEQIVAHDRMINERAK